MPASTGDSHAIRSAYNVNRRIVENTRTSKPVVSGEKCENTINKLYTIVFTGKDVEKLSQIQTGCLYTVPMGVGKSGGTFFADDRSTFENPVSLDVDIIELLKSVGIKECTIAEAINNMAGLSYFDETKCYFEDFCVELYGELKKSIKDHNFFSFKYICDHLPHGVIMQKSEEIVLLIFENNSIFSFMIRSSRRVWIFLFYPFFILYKLYCSIVIIEF